MTRGTELDLRQPSTVRYYLSGRQGDELNNGAMAQLVARFHGMEEVGGSNPPSSTTKPSSQAIWWFLRWFMAGLATPMNRIASLGAIAQLVAHLLCKQRVAGSNPASSTDTTKPLESVRFQGFLFLHFLRIATKR